jgi:hypothetical protein
MVVEYWGLGLGLGCLVEGERRVGAVFGDDLASGELFDWIFQLVGLIRIVLGQSRQNLEFLLFPKLELLLHFTVFWGLRRQLGASFVQVGD